MGVPEYGWRSRSRLLGIGGGIVGGGAGIEEPLLMFDSWRLFIRGEDGGSRFEFFGRSIPQC
jgi:hypothetical protein